MTGTLHQFPPGRGAYGISRGADGVKAPSAVPGLAELGRDQARAMAIHGMRLLLDHAAAGADCTAEIIELAFTLDELKPVEGPEAA